MKKYRIEKKEFNPNKLSLPTNFIIDQNNIHWEAPHSKEYFEIYGYTPRISHAYQYPDGKISVQYSRINKRGFLKSHICYVDERVASLILPNGETYTCPFTGETGFSEINQEHGYTIYKNLYCETRNNYYCYDYTCIDSSGNKVINPETKKDYFDDICVSISGNLIVDGIYELKNNSLTKLI